MNDGRLYENFLDTVYSATDCFEKADWSQDLLDEEI